MISRLLKAGVLAGAGALVYRVYKQYQEDSQFELAPVSNLSGTTRTVSAPSTSGVKRTLSPELLEILACPVDKKPVELYTDSDGKEWLLNPRNGNRYPIEDGIPIMLIEEGEKNRDTSLVRA